VDDLGLKKATRVCFQTRSPDLRRAGVADRVPIRPLAARDRRPKRNLRGVGEGFIMRWQGPKLSCTGARPGQYGHGVQSDLGAGSPSCVLNCTPIFQHTTEHRGTPWDQHQGI
jgi:hypothetical protein